MAKQFEIIWSPQAELDLQNILFFWFEHNKSIVFPNKLYIEILNAIEKLSIHSHLGKNISIDDYRRIIVRYYLIIYRIENNIVRILRIIDGRQKDLII